MTTRHKHADFSTLTPAEMKAVGMIVRGRTDVEVGEALKVSASTINKHRQRAMKKLGVHNVVRLTLAAVCAEKVNACEEINR